MAQKARGKLGGAQKLLLTIVGLFIAWQVLLSDTVSGTLLDFFLGGQVPGTDVILPPEIVLWGVVAAVALIFGTIALFSWRAHRRVKRASVSLAQGVDVPEQSAVVVSETQPKPKKTRAKKVEPKTPVAGPKLSTKLTAYLQQVRRRAQPLLQQANHGARKAGHVLAVYVVGSYELIRMALIRFGKWTQQKLRVAWGRTLPYLRRLDTALEKAWVRTSIWLAGHLNRNEFVQLLGEIKKAGKQVLRELHVPELWAKAMQQVRKIRGSK